MIQTLAPLRLVSKIGTDNLFPTLPTAVDAYRQRASDHPSAAGPPG
jgi:hypothetical protein